MEVSNEFVIKYFELVLFSCKLINESEHKTSEITFLR